MKGICTCVVMDPAVKIKEKCEFGVLWATPNFINNLNF